MEDAKRQEHKERRRANADARRAVSGRPLRGPGIYKLAGGEPAAVEWFTVLPKEKQSEILGESPTATCRRGRAKVIRAFQLELVRRREA